jgi:c(7)-type cytochrome triheme protein
MNRALLRLLLLATLAVLPLRTGWAEYGDITFTRPENPAPEIPVAVFPHYLHRMQFRCHVCHDAIFEMKAEANKISMEAIQNGKFCGACHNGETAFQATFDTCMRCHHT